MQTKKEETPYDSENYDFSREKIKRGYNQAQLYMYRLDRICKRIDTDSYTMNLNGWLKGLRTLNRSIMANCTKETGKELETDFNTVEKLIFQRLPPNRIMANAIKRKNMNEAVNKLNKLTIKLYTLMPNLPTTTEIDNAISETE